MSKSAKRPDVNRTATRRAGDSSDSSSIESATADSTVSVDTDASKTPSLTKKSDPDAPEVVEAEETAGSGVDETADGKSRPAKKEKRKKEPSERAKRRQAKKALQVGNPRWFVPLMLAFFIVGLVWIVVFYLTQMAYPIPNIAYWNLVIGFGLLMMGFALTTRWK